MLVSNSSSAHTTRRCVATQSPRTQPQRRVATQACTPRVATQPPRTTPKGVWQLQLPRTRPKACGNSSSAHTARRRVATKSPRTPPQGRVATQPPRTARMRVATKPPLTPPEGVWQCHLRSPRPGACGANSLRSPHALNALRSLSSRAAAHLMLSTLFAHSALAPTPSAQRSFHARSTPTIYARSTLNALNTRSTFSAWR